MKFSKTALFCSLVFISVPLFSQTSKTESQWTLGAMEYTFTQKHTERTSRENGIAGILPKLVLEQISSSSIRHTSAQELLDRKLEELLTERLSLFLQLSKEIKTRDSLILTQADSSKRKTSLQDSEKKIAELKKKIEENLSKADKAKSEFEERDAREKALLSGEKPAPQEKINEDEKNSGPEFFKKFFPKKSDSILPQMATEKVSLYKKDSSELFSVSAEVFSKGKDSREFQKAVTSAGINGLLTGEITIYGDYAAITSTLTIYPGATVAGTITEVGSLSDISRMARNIAHYLVPKISNSLPIHLFFDIVPEEAKENAQIAVDGVMYQTVPESIVVDSGIHTIEVSSEGYNPQTLTYNFENAPDFLVHLPMDQTRNAVVNLSLKNPLLGTLYANGAFLSDIKPGVPGTEVSVNGEPVIGQFISTKQNEKGEYLSSFYFIDSPYQKQGENLMVNVNPVDNASEIDKRRIWMYRGYTALVLSVPLALFGTGYYNVAYNSNVISGGTSITDSQVQFWSGFRYASLGVTVAAGSFFIYEIVRYLKAASEVLPKNAKSASQAQMEEAKNKSLLLTLPDEKKDNEIAVDEKAVDENVKEVSSDTEEEVTDGKRELRQ